MSKTTRVVETFVISVACALHPVREQQQAHRSSVPAVDVHISQVSNNESVCAVIPVNQKLA